MVRVPPSATPLEVPYTILYPLDQPSGDGAWSNPEEERDYVYQVTSVGLDVKQVRWIQEKVEQTFLSRGTGGDYENEIDPGNGATVLWRQSDQLGAIIPSGDELFKADDTYRLRVGND